LEFKLPYMMRYPSPFMRECVFMMYVWGDSVECRMWSENCLRAHTYVRMQKCAYLELGEHVVVHLGVAQVPLVFYNGLEGNMIK
jgi:hypothetical protein